MRTGFYLIGNAVIAGHRHIRFETKEHARFYMQNIVAWNFERMLTPYVQVLEFEKIEADQRYLVKLLSADGIDWLSIPAYMFERGFHPMSRDVYDANIKDLQVQKTS